MATVSRRGGPTTTGGELRAQALTVPNGARAKPKNQRSRLHKGENLFGWLFVSPSVAILVIFMVIPIFLALYVSFTNWSGLTSPFSPSVQLVGLDNYQALMTRPGLYQTDFATSVRDNFYFFLLTVPLQTALALWLATLVNNKFLRAKGFFRTAFYFPSVTSSIAITIVFIFLFQGDGVVNTVIGWFGAKGQDWIFDQSGLFTNILHDLGVSSPGWGNHMFMGLSLWDWVAGPLSACASLSSCSYGRRRVRSCCSSWPPCRPSAKKWTRPAPSTGPRPGKGSAWSPCPCCGPPSCSS